MSDVAYTIRTIPSGMTRDCVWPWNYVEVRTDSEVALCCIRPPVGNLEHSSLAEIMRNDESRELRANLLEGRLDSICQRCLLAPLTTPESLTERVRQLHLNAK